MSRLHSINLTEFFLVSFILLISVIIFHETSLDQRLITPFFSSQTPHWPWRDAFITEKIFHKGGVKLVILIALSLIGARLFSKQVKANRLYQVFIYHTFLSALLSIALVAFLKKTTPIVCPWDLKIFSGHHDFISLVNLFNFTLPAGHCFPAGHSSGAYAWIAIYFSYQLITGKRNYWLLLPGMLLGLIFGITQQMRGAHFVSHDLATILVSWLIAGTLALLFKKLIMQKI